MIIQHYGIESEGILIGWLAQVFYYVIDTLRRQGAYCSGIRNRTLQTMVFFLQGEFRFDEMISNELFTYDICQILGMHDESSPYRPLIYIIHYAY